MSFIRCHDCSYCVSHVLRWMHREGHQVLTWYVCKHLAVRCDLKKLFTSVLILDLSARQVKVRLFQQLLWGGQNRLIA